MNMTMNMINVTMNMNIDMINIILQTVLYVSYNSLCYIIQYLPCVQCAEFVQKLHNLKREKFFYFCCKLGAIVFSEWFF